MLKGMFQSFEHDHYFEVIGDGETLMRDELRFIAPLGPLGWIAETFVLRRYLEKFLLQRNSTIKEVAEASPSVWQRFLGNETN